MDFVLFCIDKQVTPQIRVMMNKPDTKKPTWQNKNTDTSITLNTRLYNNVIHQLLCRAHEINKNIHMSPLCHRTIQYNTMKDKTAMGPKRIKTMYNVVEIESTQEIMYWCVISRLKWLCTDLWLVDSRDYVLMCD